MIHRQRREGREDGEDTCALIFSLLFPLNSSITTSSCLLYNYIILRMDLEITYLLQSLINQLEALERYLEEHQGGREEIVVEEEEIEAGEVEVDPEEDKENQPPAESTSGAIQHI